MRILVSAAALGLAVMLGGPATAQTIPLDIKVAGGAAASGDTARGQPVSKKCVPCPSPGQRQNVTGPSLAGIGRRPPGSAAHLQES